MDESDDKEDNYYENSSDSIDYDYQEKDKENRQSNCNKSPILILPNSSNNFLLTKNPKRIFWSISYKNLSLFNNFSITIFIKYTTKDIY